MKRIIRSSDNGSAAGASGWGGGLLAALVESDICRLGIVALLKDIVIYSVLYTVTLCQIHSCVCHRCYLTSACCYRHGLPVVYHPGCPLLPPLLPVVTFIVPLLPPVQPVVEGWSCMRYEEWADSTDRMRAGDARCCCAGCSAGQPCAAYCATHFISDMPSRTRPRAQQHSDKRDRQCMMIMVRSVDS